VDGDDDGLPQGVQLIGRRLLDAAQAVEDRAPALTPIEPTRRNIARPHTSWFRTNRHTTNSVSQESTS